MKRNILGLIVFVIGAVSGGNLGYHYGRDAEASARNSLVAESTAILEENQKTSKEISAKFEAFDRLLQARFWVLTNEMAKPPLPPVAKIYPVESGSSK